MAAAAPSRIIAQAVLVVRFIGIAPSFAAPVAGRPECCIQLRRVYPPAFRPRQRFKSGSAALRAPLGFGLFRRVLRIAEHLLELDAERPRDQKRDLERRRILPELDRIDRLPGHADLLGELLLRHLVAIEPEPPDAILDAGLTHALEPPPVVVD